VKIAIVGGGISGLVAAHALHGRHEITLFEAEDRLGGHTHTVDVEWRGERAAIDTGFIVYNERTYPHFVRLLAKLGIETQPSDMSFGVACERSGIEWASRGLGSVFAQRRNLARPAFLRMLRDVLRFNRDARQLLEAGADEKVALGDYLCGAGYSREFVDLYAVPMGAAIWSADPQEFLRFPAAGFVRFFENHGLLSTRPGVSWRVVRGGSSRYVERLVAPFRHRVRTGSPVRAIRRSQHDVTLLVGGDSLRFDRVILAVHSDQALRLLSDASVPERVVLRSIGYQRNDVVLHTDARLMPSNRRAWASWNYRVPRTGGRGGAQVTYHMNRLQSLRTQHDYFVTLGASDRIDPDRVIGRYVYDHPVFDAEAMAAQRRHEAIDGMNRTHFCGAWWGYGFHEDGVRSALSVCRRLGGEI
jgi:uncharacterized protein